MKNERPLAGGEEARVSIGPDPQATSTPQPRRATLSAFIDTRHIIVIRQIGGLFQVTVEPDHPTCQPETFATHRDARGFAGGLKMVHRWQIADECVEASNG